MDTTTVNSMDLAAFMAAFGNVFEHSPWVAEAAWNARPFSSFDALHQAMTRVVSSAPQARIHQLLCLHPDLAGKEAQQGIMTASSVSEQSSAGLNALSAAELQQIRELNAAYRGRHHFPFIIAVRNFSKADIFDEFARRLKNDSATELDNNLEQIFSIVRLRLERIVEPAQPLIA